MPPFVVLVELQTDAPNHLRLEDSATDGAPGVRVQLAQRGLDPAVRAGAAVQDEPASARGDDPELVRGEELVVVLVDEVRQPPDRRTPEGTEVTEGPDFVERILRL